MKWLKQDWRVQSGSEDTEKDPAGSFFRHKHHHHKHEPRPWQQLSLFTAAQAAR